METKDITEINKYTHDMHVKVCEDFRNQLLQSNTIVQYSKDKSDKWNIRDILRDIGEVLDVASFSLRNGGIGRVYHTTVPFFDIRVDFKPVEKTRLVAKPPNFKIPSNFEIIKSMERPEREIMCCNYIGRSFLIRLKEHRTVGEQKIQISKAVYLHRQVIIMDKKGIRADIKRIMDNSEIKDFDVNLVVDSVLAAIDRQSDRVILR